MIWRELEHFSSGAISVVLASRPYEESDYIRAYDDFVLEKRGRPRAPDPPAEVG
jgi:hypothetical protein